MRYTRLRVWAIFFTVVIGVIIVLNYSSGGPGMYKSSDPITDSLLTADYPRLYQAISNRDIQQLRPFLSHAHSKVRSQSWRAFANTPVDSVSPFIELAKQQNSEAAWFGISRANISKAQLRSLEQSWQENPEHRLGIARVLGQQGDQESLDFLIAQLDDSQVNASYHFALAIGRLLTRFDVGTQQEISVIQKAFSTENYRSTRAYLYGWYRSDESTLSSVAQDTLFNRWQVMGIGINTEVDQYVNKILPERTTYTATIYYNGEQQLDNEAQLGIELANSIAKVPMDDRNSLAAKILLTNANPHVQVRVLQSLSGKLRLDGDLFSYIRDMMIPDTGLADIVWLQALQAGFAVDSTVVKGHRNRLDSIAQNSPYLLPEVLAVYRRAEAVSGYLQKTDQLVSRSDTLAGMYALQELNNFWKALPEEQRNAARADRLRSIVFQALEKGDRGVHYMSVPLLRNEQLFGSSDFKEINSSLSAFTLPADVEVYQAFGSLYKDRFESHARATIDSLADLGYAPLNRSLADAGWQVEVSEKSDTSFRLPDWNRLWELGEHPVWTLQTEQGRIKVQLNTLQAPATVAMIDSLSRAGNYDGIPFHRVVPNFVIQGGDIERQDGFGGPDFALPTEASEVSFNRGSIGIASAGTDTEGSQYFFMHQWKPHLNGSYSRFGEVVDGMDVVDEIIVGDKVLSTTWY